MLVSSFCFGFVLGSLELCVEELCGHGGQLLLGLLGPLPDLGGVFNLKQKVNYKSMSGWPILKINEMKKVNCLLI